MAQRNPAAAALYIVPGAGGGRDSLFATHPDTGNRIAQLEAIALEMGLHARPRTAGPVTAGKPRRASALDPHRGRG